MRSYLLLSVFAVATLAIVAGCSQSASDTNTGSAPAPGTTLTLANAVCPVMGGPADEAVTVAWNGQTVGFCCAGCIDKWNELSEEEKAEKLATVGETPATDAMPMSHDAS